MCDAFNSDLMNRFPLASGRPPSKTFKPFSEAELLAFIGILIAAGVHKKNKENLDDMWKGDALPFIRAAMSRDQFKMMLRFTGFDNKNTRAERGQTDKTAPLQDISCKKKCKIFERLGLCPQTPVPPETGGSALRPPNTAHPLQISCYALGSNNRMVMRNHFLRGAVEMVLGRQFVTSRENAAVTRAPHGSR